MQLFYNPDISEANNDVVFSKDESRHIIKVLRKGEGDVLHITNGKGWLFNAEIVSADIKQCRANIESKSFREPKSYGLHLAVAPTKMNDRFEWFLEKATEIGIQSITPIICENSERTKIKQERYHRILQSALKQSLQLYLPKLHNAISFKDFIEKEQPGLQFIAHCEDDDKTLLKDNLIPNTSVIVLIGPEGDFSTNEIKMASSAGYKQISLGENRLRTETAAIVACHTFAILNQ